MDIIEILKSAIIGIIQGITEWLPISSTGHMILADEFLKLNITPQFKEMFFVVIQLGSILAVVVLYFHKLNPFSPKKSRVEKGDTIILWTKVIVGAIPAGIIGMLFNDFFEENFYNYIVVAIALIVYGVLFIVLENRNKRVRPQVRSLDELTYGKAFLIGMCQCLALIPGTSRSGSTILGGIFFGTSRFVATEFSFFLAVPIMFGASIVKMRKFGLNFSPTELSILVTGMVVAFVVSVIAIKFLVGYIKKNDFKAFGYYRIVLGIVVVLYFLFLA